MSTLFTNISTLVTHVSGAEVLESAALVVENGKVAWIGPQNQAPSCDQAHDLEGRTVIPGFVDSHAHLVHAGDRSNEFVARMKGESYSAGGIKSTVNATREASDTDLRSQTQSRIEEILRSGTTTFESKTGYGLTLADEERLAAITREFTDEVTFLGAHVVPSGIAREEYVELVKGPMLDACAPHSKWIDVFCDRGAFTVDEAEAILKAGAAKGLGLRLHGNQLEHGGGVQLAVDLDAASVDHCTHLSDADIAALAGSETVATLLPSAEFSTRSPYPPARRLIEAGATVALATDCNPGSSYTTNMAFCIALAVREMAMDPYEALRAATLGGAKALRRDEVGHLGVGANAHFAVLDAPSYIHLAYRPGVDLIYAVHHTSYERKR